MTLGFPVQNHHCQTPRPPSDPTQRTARLYNCSHSVVRPPPIRPSQGAAQSRTPLNSRSSLTGYPLHAELVRVHSLSRPPALEVTEFEVSDQQLAR
ncbi:hypothetical protein PI125_g7870 [Phytophthora idaei]|nr:hypothetical protein PI125_g7870 [Phytophthora idaei]